MGQDSPPNRGSATKVRFDTVKLVAPASVVWGYPPARHD